MHHVFQEGETDNGSKKKRIKGRKVKKERPSNEAIDNSVKASKYAVPARRRGNIIGTTANTGVNKENSLDCNKST
jgi:hypothetical protein